MAWRRTLVVLPSAKLVVDGCVSAGCDAFGRAEVVAIDLERLDGRVLDTVIPKNVDLKHAHF